MTKPTKTVVLLAGADTDTDTRYFHCDTYSDACVIVELLDAKFGAHNVELHDYEALQRALGRK